ncbi:glypican-4 [Anopheles aquasalis]|uniref:glypican-4 n=1 Tax=Anopheles aquasalis TaxID=42839 RepID=UPI00215B1B87|nr:glypican-4 [Anopheles aquasalis]XP_050087550.1 glypican-4 [Anopheles aquasalis]XP_050087551.1 glypican-4 [Anopheles aquasalis]
MLMKYIDERRRRRRPRGERTMAAITASGSQRKGAVGVPVLLLLCVGLAVEGVLGSAIPSASFPPNSAGLANSASSPAGADGGGSMIRRPGATVAGASSGACVAVHPILQRRGVEQIDMPIDAIPDLTLRHCEVPVGVGTCCTQTTEHKLALHSKTMLERNTKDNISKLSSVLGARAVRFNEFFEKLLTESKHEFHAMFKRTYGTIYEQNSYVFADLFAELERYYAHGKVDLAETMDHFFNILFQKMFTVLNAQYSFDNKYLGCVSEHMKELKPFGDVPDKLSVQIKRSFVATRTYAQALASAAEAAKNMVNVRLSAECTAALTKMSTCNVCAGQTKKPCVPYCLNVVKGCFQSYDEVGSQWDTFVSKMERVSERLLGPFNIVMVVAPIDIKISEAIMNFQENGKDISDRIFQGCGQPALGRMRRSVDGETLLGANGIEDHPHLITALKRQLPVLSLIADASDADSQFTFDEDDGAEDSSDVTEESDKRISKRSAGGSGAGDSTSRELKYEPLQFSDGDVQFTNSNGPPLIPALSPSGNADSNGGGGRANRRKHKNGRKPNAEQDEQDNQEPMIDRLVKDIRQKVRDSKRFWAQLPYMLCNNEDIAEQDQNDASCWNGTAVDRYQPIQNVEDSSTNPEFPNKVYQSRPSTIVQQQLFVLRTAISHLDNAYVGHDVEWTDQEDGYYGSGSGQGSGIDYEDSAGSGMGLWEIDVRNERRPGSFDTGSPTGANTVDSGSVSANGHPDRHPSEDPDYTGSRSGLPTVTGSSAGSGNGGTSTATGSHKAPDMSIQRALLQFFLPIVMAWFGGLFADLL